jgi:hypothetical protein
MRVFPNSSQVFMARMPTRPFLLPLILLVAAFGCGSTKSRLATEQLLVSDAVDDAVNSIDFRSLAGENVYFDMRYLVNVKGIGFVNSEYIISSLRQQMVAADLRLKEKPEDADYVVEARVGTLGSDGNEIIYGIPANKGLSDASTMLPNAPPLPAIPEISVARKESQLGAVKVAAFAYDRKTGSPVWQSGIARAKTTSQDVWLFGAGPFQRGSIHTGTQFAGGEINLPGNKKPGELALGSPVAVDKEFYFPRPEQASATVATNPPQASPPGPRLAAQPEGKPGPAQANSPPAPKDVRPLPPVSNEPAIAPSRPDGAPPPNRASPYSPSLR